MAAIQRRSEREGASEKSRSSGLKSIVGVACPTRLRRRPDAASVTPSAGGGGAAPATKKSTFSIVGCKPPIGLGTSASTVRMTVRTTHTHRGGAHREARPGRFGNRRRASSGPWRISASRIRCDSGDSLGWRCLIPALAISTAAVVNAVTMAALSAGDIRRQPSICRRSTSGEVSRRQRTQRHTEIIGR